MLLLSTSAFKQNDQQSVPICRRFFVYKARADIINAIISADIYVVDIHVLFR